MDPECGLPVPASAGERTWLISSWQTVLDVGNRILARLTNSQGDANPDETESGAQSKSIKVSYQCMLQWSIKLTEPTQYPVEDYPQGYPRYSALVASDEAFYIFRGFSHLRSRLLLLKQDKLVVLEKRLRELDDTETVPLFLGASREDENRERLQVLDEIDVALSDYC